MGKNNLLQDIKQSNRLDAGRRDFGGFTTGVLWHAPNLAASGNEAVGYQSYRKEGPVVLAAEISAYAQYLEEFQLPGGKYFIDPGRINEVLNEKDLILRQLEAPEQSSKSEAQLRAELDEVERRIKVIEDEIKNKTEQQKLFAQDNVREFLLLSDGLTNIDYNQDPAAWEVVILGPFYEASYCMIKPALGGQAQEMALVADGATPDEVQQPEQGLSFSQRVQRLRNFTSSPAFACKQPFTRSDGRITGLRSRYPTNGDIWLGGSLRISPLDGLVEIYRKLDIHSRFIKSDNTNKLTISGSQLEVETDPRAVAFGDYAENPAQVLGSSNALTPIPRFRARMTQFNFVAAVYNVLRGLLDELESDIDSQLQASGQRTGLQYEVLDFNDFVPPARQVQ